MCLYFNGKWAEIIELPASKRTIFTMDGIGLHYGDLAYKIVDDTPVVYCLNMCGELPDQIYSTEQAANEGIYKKKVKELQKIYKIQ